MNKVSEVAQLYLTLCDPMDCSLPGSSIHGIFPGKNTGVGRHFLLQEIFLTQGLNPGLPHCRQMLYHLSHQGRQSLKALIKQRLRLRKQELCQQAPLNLNCSVSLTKLLVHLIRFWTHQAFLSSVFSNYRSFTSLVRFIPRHFTFSGAPVSEVVFLMSLSDSSLLVNSNIRDSCVLILYSATWLN